MRRRLVCLLVLVLSSTSAAQVRLADASDRAAFRAWFVFLADAQFYRPTPDVVDCAALVRHAAREALRPHTPEWTRTAALPLARSFPDVRARPPLVDAAGAPRGLALFRVSSRARAPYGEFADAQTLIRLNARFVSRDPSAAQPGDLLYFHQPSQEAPHHVMVFVGTSAFEADGRDWVVYHTGPTSGDRAHAASPGEVRKARLSDLLRHPAPRWRPVAANPHFIGVFRLDWL
jgi:uncharacterized protein YfaT (DUF1175 family)